MFGSSAIDTTTADSTDPEQLSGGMRTHTASFVTEADPVQGLATVPPKPVGSVAALRLVTFVFVPRMMPTSLVG